MTNHGPRRRLTQVGTRLVPDSTLERVRRVFLVVAVLASLFQIPVVLTSPGASIVARQASVLGLMVLAGTVVWLYRRGRPHPALDVAACLAMLALGLTHGDSTVAVAALFPTILFTSSYGSTRRIVLFGAGLVTAFLVTIATSANFDGRQVPGYLVSSVSMIAVLHLLTVYIRRSERSLAYQRSLVSAGTRLVAAHSRQDVYDAAIESAHAMLENDPVISAALLLPSEGRMVVVGARGAQADALVGMKFDAAEVDSSLASFRVPAQMAPFREVLVAQLLLKGELAGSLALASTTTVPDDTEDAVRALAAETVLALETLSVRERFRSLVQHSSDVITIVDPDGLVTYQSPSFEKLTGVPAPSTLGTQVTDLVHPGDRAGLSQQFADRTMSSLQLDVRWHHAEGQWRQTETVVTNMVEDHNVGGWVLNTRDVTERAELEVERRALEERLAWRATHDALTGLANRAAFTDRLDQIAIEPGSRPFAVLFIDLDRFKPVNDTLGHAAGDQVLCTAADRMRTSVRSGGDGREADLVCRLGGDEFAIMLVDVTEELARSTATRLLDLIARPIAVAGNEVTVTAAVGVAISRPDWEHPEDAVRHADRAMYLAKKAGPGQYRMHDRDTEGDPLS